LEDCGPFLVIASYTLAFALQLRKKHGKTSVRVAEGCQLARWKQNIQNSVMIGIGSCPITCKLYLFMWGALQDSLYPLHVSALNVPSSGRTLIIGVIKQLLNDIIAICGRTSGNLHVHVYKVHTHCILNTKGYKHRHTLRIRNT
jgi:hypothetical protein